MHTKTNRHLQAKIRARQARRSTMRFTGGVRAYVAMITIVGLLFSMLPEAFAASSWSPTLLVNTEAFETLDDDDPFASIELRFGDTLQEKISYNRFFQRFQFSRGIYVSGNGVFTGSLLVNAGTTFGGAESALEVLGVMSGTTVYATKSFSGAGLTDCDTAGTSKLLWDAATGRFSCGTDQTGGGTSNWSNTGSLQGYFDNRFVNQSGDTMTGALNVQNGTVHTPAGAPLLNVRGSLSGSTAFWNGGRNQLNTDQGGAIEMGGTNTAINPTPGGSPYIDFHYGLPAAQDYNMRIINSANNALSIQSPVNGAVATFSGSFVGVGKANPRSALDAPGTISGGTLRVSGNATIHGALSATGNVITDGDIVINDDLTAATDASLTFGNVTTSQTLKFVHSLQKFSFSAPVRVLGNLSGSSLTIDRNGTFSGNVLVKGNDTVKGTISGTTINANSLLTGTTIQGFGLYGCNGASNKITYNSTTKKFLCETDQTGGSSGGGGMAFSTAENIYVNQAGDTMTGTLQIRPTAGPLTFGLRVAAAMSGRSLTITGTGSKPIISTDVKRGFLGIGTDTPSDKLTLSGGVFQLHAGGNLASMSGITIGALVQDIYVTGRFAFVGSQALAGNELQIYDVNDPSAPRVVGGIDVGAGVTSVLVVGRYLYLSTFGNSGTCARGVLTGCEFRIYDITNMTSPVAISGIDVVDDGLSDRSVNDFKIVGELLYLVNASASGNCSGATGATLTGCEFRVYDISNPYAPAAIGGYNAGAVGLGVHVSGGFAYATYANDGGANNELSIYSIANHSNIQLLGGVNETSGFSAVTVTGKYAYVSLQSANAGTCSGGTVTGCEFRIYDVSSSASPTAVSGMNTGSNTPSDIKVLGTMAYVVVSDSGDNDLKIINVQNPSAPALAGGAELGSSASSLYVAGKYVYCSATVSGLSGFLIADAAGIEAPLATIGAVQTSNLTVSETANINNTLYVGNGLNVGRGGVNLRGQLSIQSTSTGSLFTGLDIKNLTGTTMFSVADNGFADVMRGAVSYNGMLAQEFNDERAAATADSVAWGDDGTWVMDVSTTTCSFKVNETWPSAARSEISAAGVGCNQYLGIAAGDPMNFISATGSLARVLIKARVGSNASNQRVFAGLFVAAAANNITEPTEGVYFSGSGATYTEWQATVNPLTGVSTYVRCPGATIRTGAAQYALLDITFEAPSRVRFRVDPDTSDGINFINCGWVNPSGIKNFMGVGLLHQTITGFTGNSQLDVDYVRVWTQ